MIHKKDFGDVYCFRLFKNDDLVKKLYENNTITKEFYNLQYFKPTTQFPVYPKEKSRIIKF